MKTEEEIEASMDAAEAEIMEILNTRGLYLGMLYPEGVGITLGFDETHPSGDVRVFEREIDA